MNDLNKSFIASVGVAVPPLSISQEEALDMLNKNYSQKLNPAIITLAKKIFRHPSVKSRHFAVDDINILINENPDLKMLRFTEWATKLSVEASKIALQKAGITEKDITAVVVNTCTGYICPGISNYVIEKMGFNRDIFAYDLVGAGCAGALPNIMMGSSIVNSKTDSAMLSISVEICSAAFQMDNDLSLIVSNSLFGDGASACVIWNKPKGLQLLDSSVIHKTEYREDIRFIYKNGQLYNQLSSKLPELVGITVSKLVFDLLKKNGLEFNDIKHWAIHGGGENVIDAVSANIGLSEQQMQKTRQILSEYGNMSSPSVMFALDKIIDEGINRGEIGILLSFGAGMSAYASLFKKV